MKGLLSRYDPYYLQRGSTISHNLVFTSHILLATEQSQRSHGSSYGMGRLRLRVGYNEFELCWFILNFTGRLDGDLRVGTPINVYIQTSRV